MKGKETDPASNQFPKCSPSSGTQRFTELGREEKGEGRDKAIWWGKRRVQRRREWSSQ